MNINRIPAPRTLAALALAAALGFGLTACSTGASPTPASTAGTAGPVATNTPDASDVAPVAAVTAAPAPSPTVTADQYSQVIGGKLYQGTEAAPVKIGTDTPGAKPAAETGNIPAAQFDAAAQAAGKYVVYIGRYPNGSGWFWKVFGPGTGGYWGTLAHKGYNDSSPYGSRQAALDAPKIVDGRELDRSEYLLFVQQ